MSESVPVDWFVQVVPLLVARIVPSIPTAKHVIVPGQVTPSSSFVVPEVSVVHVEPLSVLRRNTTELTRPAFAPLAM